MYSEDAGQQSSTLVRRYEPELAALSVDVTTVVIIADSDQIQLGHALAARYPEAQVHFLAAVIRAGTAEKPPAHPRLHYRVARSVNQRISYLMTVPRPQVMVDASTAEVPQRLGNLRHLYYFVEKGGCYLALHIGEKGVAQVTDTDGIVEEPEHTTEHQDLTSLLTAVATTRSMARQAAASCGPVERELAESTGRIVFDEASAVLHKTIPHLLKLREWEADEVLNARYGTSWGRTLVEIPATTFVSRASVTSHGDGPIPGRPRTFEVPTRRIREYEDVICPSFQIAVHRDLVLPDSWRHPHARVLGHRHLIYASARFARLKPRYTPPEPRRIEGSLYLLDTEHPAHFGHITTEVLSRVWGWRQQFVADPTLRPLLSSHGPDRAVPKFQVAIFRALGIPLDDAVVIHPRDVIRVDRLVAATPQFENPYYVDPDIQTVWRELLAGLPQPRTPAHPRIFVSRRPGSKRFCYETRKVESFFARRGFHVFYPEDLDFVEQAHLFARAEIVAGFGGSGMFTMLLAPKARIAIVTGNGYNAENEHLIAAVNGNRLDYFWGRSDLQTSDGFTQLESARSNFHFDLRQHRRSLERVLS